MENIWFYTLSTSAQVLAALAGLFAVFVVWKIQDLGKIIIELRSAAIKIIPYCAANTQDYEQKNYKDFYFMEDLKILEIFSELLEIKKNDPSRMTIEPYVVENNNLTRLTLDESTESLYKRSIAKRAEVLSDLKKILIANFAVISICILALTFSSIIFYKLITLIVISCAVLYCLYLISRGIYEITTK